MKDLSEEKSNIRGKKIGKQMLLDLIKILLLVLILSVLFHEKINEFLTRFSDIAFHHYFISSFFILLFLSITIEFEFYNGSHLKNMKKKLTSIRK
jgi:predicted membrane protein